MDSSFGLGIYTFSIRPLFQDVKSDRNPAGPGAWHLLSGKLDSTTKVVYGAGTIHKARMRTI
jgi:hypothetical protein